MTGRLRFITMLLVLIAALLAGGWLFFQIKTDEEVAYYSPYLFWDREGKLRLVLRGRLYEPEKSSRRRRAAIDRVIVPNLFNYIGKKPSDFDDDARALMYQRLAAFVYDSESLKSIQVRIKGDGGEAVLQLPRTDAGGHFTIVTDSAEERSLVDLVGAGKELVIQAVLPRKDKREFAARVSVPPRRLSLLVVSDVDDTVRIAEVTNRPKMIERVFLRPYEAVPGMSAIYGRLADPGARFHYVSGSPWQIGPVIQQFLDDAKFPPAVLHCRRISWDFWNRDPLDTKEYKVATIKTLLEQFDNCPVLLIGDSGEQDPEVYTDICRDHASRIAGIWIRRVGRWDPARLADAAKTLGAGRVIVFGDAEELRADADKLAKSIQTKPAGVR